VTDPRLVKCADWMLQKQVRRPGDWKIKNPKGEPGGWYFEFNNEFYPDVDDSAMVCLALSRVEHPEWGAIRASPCSGRSLWIFSMQCKDGGWASFDKDNDRMVLFQYVPLPITTPCLIRQLSISRAASSSVLQRMDTTRTHQAVKRAIKFIRKQQEPDGSWFGRWGVNYIYGTMQVLRGLEAMNVERNDPMVQQASGSGCDRCRTPMRLGETVGSYDDPTFAAQAIARLRRTAWAIMGLLAVGDTRSECVARGMRIFCERKAKTVRGRGFLHWNRFPAACSI